MSFDLFAVPAMLSDVSGLLAKLVIPLLHCKVMSSEILWRLVNVCDLWISVGIVQVKTTTNS